MPRWRNPLGRWLLSVALSLALCLGGWWLFLRESLIEGLAKSVNFIVPWLWPDTVLSVLLQDHLGSIVTLIPPLTDPLGPLMALPLSFNHAVVVFPLFWGLTLGTPGRARFRRLLLGTAILWLIAFAMTLLYVQFQLVLYRTHQPMLTEIPPRYYALALPDSPTATYLWGLGRQLALLVLPIAAPLLLWLALHGAFLRAVILGSLLNNGLARAEIAPATPHFEA